MSNVTITVEEENGEKTTIRFPNAVFHQEEMHYFGMSAADYEFRVRAYADDDVHLAYITYPTPDGWFLYDADDFWADGGILRGVE